MAILEQGYAVGEGLLSSADIEDLRAGITDTTNRIARGFLTPFETSCPALPLEARLEQAAHQDRAYAYALLHGVFADAQRDPRLAGLADHPALLDRVRQLVAPRQVTGHVVRVRVNIPSFPQKQSAWHQDVTDRSDLSRQPSPIGLACWIPLVDATEANGTLEVLPGAYDQPYPHEQTADGKFYIPDDRLPQPPAVTLPCPAGDVIFLDRYVPHRTLPNRTNAIRWNVVMWVKCDSSRTDE